MAKKGLEGPIPRRGSVTAIPIRPTTKRAAAEQGIQNAGAYPDREEIARLAHSYWVARGCPDGSPEEDWFRAENELRGRKGQAPARFGPGRASSDRARLDSRAGLEREA